jgi:hypothetical protein
MHPPAGALAITNLLVGDAKSLARGRLGIQVLVLFSLLVAQADRPEPQKRVGDAAIAWWVVSRPWITITSSNASSRSRSRSITRVTS